MTQTLLSNAKLGLLFRLTGISIQGDFDPSFSKNGKHLVYAGFTTPNSSLPKNTNSMEATFSETIPENYSLNQNYPNPFNPSTTISFSLPEASDVNVTIYNMLGQVVAQVINNNFSAGFYSFDFDASDFTSGIYIYSIKAIGQNGSNFVNSN